MARRTATIESTDEQLYIPPIADGPDTAPDTDTDSGSGSAAADSGSTTDAPYGYFPDGRPRKRAARTANRTKTERISQTVHSAAQTRGIAKAISVSAQSAFNAIATVRTMQLGYMPDPTSMTGFLFKVVDGNQVPVGAGDCWKLDPKDANDLGKAWAEVVALYCPPELVERSSVIATAVVTTGMILATRVYADIQTQALLHQMQQIRAEGVAQMPGMGSMNTTQNGTTESTGYEFSRQES